jgi:hypothetical protein
MALGTPPVGSISPSEVSTTPDHVRSTFWTDARWAGMNNPRRRTEATLRKPSKRSTLRDPFLHWRQPR